ncbi:hypothetical protein EP331_12515 [bacterium]|nr:MAG: hypothetical protein EP331_12515 [bacterium]
MKFMNSIIPQQKYSEILALLNQVGQEIIQKRQQRDFEVFQKPDQSQVTNVDIWANEFIISRMQLLFPDDSFVGEESEDKSYPIGSERVWYIDPIDGTNNFVAGNPHFFVLIGLAVNGIPTLGFCYKPSEELLIFTQENDIVFTQNNIAKPIPYIVWNPVGSLVQKHVTPEQKAYLELEFHQKKEPYIFDMVSQLGPIFNKSNGYIGFRRSYYWDICAPAAIMSKLGFSHEFYHAFGAKALMNDKSVKCRSYYSLPQDTPDELKEWFEKEASKLDISND